MGGEYGRVISIFFAALIQLTSPAVPPPGNTDLLVRESLETVLRDVSSARLSQIRAPRWATVREDAWTVKTGWAVCYSINAQNGYGGYTGAKTWLFVISDDKVEMRLAGGRSMWIDGVIDRECSQPSG